MEKLIQIDTIAAFVWRPARPRFAAIAGIITGRSFGSTHREISMALVRSIVATATVRTTVHQPTHCEYSIVRSKGGGVFAQLDTFGSATRKCVGKVSQSIQLDEPAAKQLIDILRDTFPNLS